MPLSQEERTLAVSTPLGEDVLLLRSMSGTERLSTLFAYELDLISEDLNIRHEDLLGQPVTVRLDLPDEKQRYFNGIVNRFSLVGFDGAVAVYVATLVPWTWFLTRTADCRIFQEKTVPDIVKEIFREQGFTDFEERLSGSYRQWVYCVQYRETDFNFISRLLEQEGIYYFFTHEDGKHKLILADSYSAHNAVPGYEEIPYYPPDETSLRERDHISDWSVEKAVQPGTFAHMDYDFAAPKKNLLAKRSNPKEHAFSDSEIYDYPGEYTESDDGENYARVRLEEMHAEFESVKAEGNTRGLTTGTLFTLTGYPREDQNREHLVSSADYRLQSDLFGSGNQTYEVPVFQCRITAINAQTPYRPPRSTPKPVVQGPQTAVVVGKSGEKIWTDKYGRVKVQFHWDRYGKSDEHSSSWVRVSHPWAGKNWGDMFMPHIGQEVIVSFLEGDPDQPIITGRVYNQDNMPPECLPGNQTKSVWRDHGGNETIMEGAEGKQFIHTQQSCGNEFLMDGSRGGEKIELRDKYGNEIVLDAVAGTIRLYSPTHESEIVLGRSIQLTTLSNWINDIAANRINRILGDESTEIVGKAEIKVGADVTEAYLGAENKVTVGLRLRVSVGSKTEALFVNETKLVKGLKIEITNGTNLKSHRGKVYETNPEHGKRTSGGMLTQIGGIASQFVGKWKMESKANAEFKAANKASINADTLAMQADGQCDLKIKKLLIDAADWAQIDCTKHTVNATTIKEKGKIDFNNGVVSIKQ